MGGDDKICNVNYKKYTIILNEVIEGLTRVHQDLSQSLHTGNRVQAKFKAAVVSLKCIDRKYRNLLFDYEPSCIQCTTEYLESKKKEREKGRNKLETMRKEYYMQEEHMSKLSHTLQETEKELVIQSMKCTHEGLLVSRLLWIATKPRSVLEKLTSNCASQLHDFLNLVEGCLYAFAVTYRDSMPDPCSDEYQYVISLCGILTNLSSIPEGRLFLMWNPFGRAIYTLVLDMMGSISVKKTGSLKWMILIMVYNILVNPLGRKFILKHPLLRDNLEGCLLPPNCVDVIGAALYIIKLFVDDFIDDNDMISVLMYQLPLKQVYSLSLSTNDANISKIALTIVTKFKEKLIDCHAIPSPADSSLSTLKQTNFKSKKQKRLITTSVMTSNMSISAEYETEDTDYTNSETETSSTAEKNASSKEMEITSSILVKPHESTCKLFKEPSINVYNEICETPSLRAKGIKKLTIKTIFKPSASKNSNLSCIELRAYSTGRLEGVPPLKQKSKSEELLLVSQNKLMNVNTKTVITMLSKLDLDTYLHPSYDGFGIPLKSNDCPYCCKSSKKSSEKNVSRRTADRTACSCVKTTDTGKCSQLVCVCEEIAARRDRSLNATKGKITKIKDCTSSKVIKQIEEPKKVDDGKNSLSCIIRIEKKKECGQQVCVCDEIAATEGKIQEYIKKDTEVNRFEKQAYQGSEGQEVCVCSDEIQSHEAPKNVKIRPILELQKHFKEIECAEADAYINKTEEKGQQVCVYAKIVARYAQTAKSAWSEEKENKSLLENSNKKNEHRKANDSQEVCNCSEEEETTFDTTETVIEKCRKVKSTKVKSTITQNDAKSIVRFENQECCKSSNQFNQLTTLKIIEDANEACTCMNKTKKGDKCGQQVCVCAEIAARCAQTQKGPWLPHKGKVSKKLVHKNYNTTYTSTNNDDAQDVCDCFEETEKSIEMKVETTTEVCLRHKEKSTQAITTGLKKAEKLPVRFDNQKTCVCTETTNQSETSEKTEETCECINKPTKKDKCLQQLCVCAEIAARQAKAKKGEWLPSTQDKSSAKTEEDNKMRKPLDENCMCLYGSNQIGHVEKLPVRFENEKACVCTENNRQSETSKKTEVTCACIDETVKESKYSQSMCVFTEILLKQQENEKTPQTGADEHTKFANIDHAKEVCICSGKMTNVRAVANCDKKSDTVADKYMSIHEKTAAMESIEFTKTNKSSNTENHTCSENIHKPRVNIQNVEACECINKSAKKNKCLQQLCVCAEIAARQAKAKKGEWLPRTQDKRSAKTEEDNTMRKPLDENCMCLYGSNQIGHRETTSNLQQNAIEMQTISIASMHPSSSHHKNISVHSRLIIRKTSGLRRKPQINYSKVAEHKNLHLADCSAKSKGHRTSCGDDCESCMITLPVIDIAKLVTEHNEQLARVDTGGDNLKTCGCTCKNEKTKAVGEKEQKSDKLKLETTAEAEANVEEKNQIDQLTTGCLNKCKRKAEAEQK